MCLLRWVRRGVLGSGMTDLRVIDFPVPKDVEPNDEVIAMLELLLECAKQGSIRSFAYVAMPPDGNAPPATGFTGQDRNGLAMGFAMLMENGVMWRRVNAQS